MNRGALFWIIVFALSTACFFVVAAIVAVKGSYDLRALLRSTKAGRADRTTDSEPAADMFRDSK